jgi:hypothetical protein
MDRMEFIAGAGIVAAASTSPALAQRGRAFLDHAVPGVGLTVSGSLGRSNSILPWAWSRLFPAFRLQASWGS